MANIPADMPLQTTRCPSEYRDEKQCEANDGLPFARKRIEVILESVVSGAQHAGYMQSKNVLTKCIQILFYDAPQSTWQMTEKRAQRNQSQLFDFSAERNNTADEPQSPAINSEKCKASIVVCVEVITASAIDISPVCLNTIPIVCEHH